MLSESWFTAMIFIFYVASISLLNASSPLMYELTAEMSYPITEEFLGGKAWSLDYILGGKSSVVYCGNPRTLFFNVADARIAWAAVFNSLKWLISVKAGIYPAPFQFSLAQLILPILFFFSSKRIIRLVSIRAVWAKEAHDYL